MERTIPEDNRILYYRRDREGFRFLSHFFAAEVGMDGTVWPTAEHAYQSYKSDDRSYRRAIREAPSPGYAKWLAAQPGSDLKSAQKSWFKKAGSFPRADWHEVKLDIMRRIDLAKYTQHPLLGEWLLATGDAELVEDSTSEPFWGIGPDGNGLNWAGRVLMEVREQLRTSTVIG